MRTRGTAYDPWHHADQLLLRVEQRRLAHGIRGLYLHDERQIFLAPGMTRRQARSTLAHEVQHALAGDRPTKFGPVHQRQEARARRGAAAMLVDPSEYAVAEDLCGPNLAAIAYELEVTLQVVADWVSMLANGYRFGYLSDSVSSVG